MLSQPRAPCNRVLVVVYSGSAVADCGYHSILAVYCKVLKGSTHIVALLNGGIV
jgi:hypothetical protein